MVYAEFTMAETKLPQIRGIYGTVKGMLSQIPLENQTKSRAIATTISQQYNAAIDRLSAISDTDYSDHKLTDFDGPFGAHISNSMGQHGIASARVKMGSLISRLEEEYNFGAATQNSTPPLFISMNQNQQQVSMTLIPIQQFIDSAEDNELRQELEELKHAVEVNKSPQETTTILGKILNKSWEVFIKILPYVFEHLGKNH